DLKAGDYAHLSSVLLCGFEQRLGRYGGALAASLEGSDDLRWAALEEAATSAMAHDQAREGPGRAQVVAMSARLARRLRARTETTAASSFVDAASDYARDGAFADWARYRVWDGDHQPQLGAACQKLSDRTTNAREDENRLFGKLIAQWTSLGSSS